MKNEFADCFGQFAGSVTLGWWESSINEMIQKGMVYALNELADQYDMYFYEVADEDSVRWYTQDDGNIYGYPNSSTSPRDVEEKDNVASNQTFLVRKDIYEALGEPDMTTQEGFKQAVRDAVKLFPEVDGEPLIPIGSQVFTNEGCVSFDGYLMNFLAVPWEKDGKYYDRYTDPEFLSWLNTFRELGTEGYLAMIFLWIPDPDGRKTGKRALFLHDLSVYGYD